MTTDDQLAELRERLGLKPENPATTTPALDAVELWLAAVGAEPEDRSHA